MLTIRQNLVACAIRDYRHLHGFAPTFRELAEALSCSKVTIHGHIRELERKGVVRSQKFKVRSLAIVNDKELPVIRRNTLLPIMGEINGKAGAT